MEAQRPFEPESAALDEVSRDELFGLLLRDALIAQPEFEVLLTRLRAALLLDRELRARAPLDFLCDLALQCFNNEFIFAEAQTESAQVAELQCEIEANLRDPGSADVMGVQASDLVIPDLADIGCAGAEVGDPDNGVCRRAA